MTGIVQDQNGDKRTEKQIGCMSGLLQIFDRQQILAGKRIHSSKRLPPSTGVGASPEPVKSGESQDGELGQPEPSKQVVVVVPIGSDRFQSPPAENANGRPIATSPQSPLPQKTPVKSCKEMPRISLDGRATVDSKGNLRPRELRTENSVLSANRTNGETAVADGDDNQRRSPSVIARLMGLEPLSSSDHKSSEPVAKPALRRSASESRVSRDLFHSKYIDGNNFQLKLPNQTHKQSVEVKLLSKNTVRDNAINVGKGNSFNGRGKSESSRTSPWRSPQQRRSFFDSADFFPEPNQTTVLMYGDFEKKLKMRGMDEHSSDLDTLKQILDVLQLKGLLHSTKPSNRQSNRNVFHDRNFSSNESSIVLMKPSRSLSSNVDNHRSGSDSRGVRRHAGEISPSIDRSRRSPVRARNSSSHTRIESNLKSCNSIVKRKPLSIEIQRRANEPSDSLRNSPINSPKLTPKRSGSDHHSTINRSPRNQKPTESSSINPPKRKIVKNIVTEDESSSIFESTVSSSSPTDTERSKTEGYREGSNLLQRCNKLLHSIAEMNSAIESPPISGSVLPSPVSVLDSAFDKDESSSPSPIMKRSIEFKASSVDFDEDSESPAIKSITSTNHEEFTSNDPDFIYISEILRASQSLHEDGDLFLSLEKQQSLNNKDASKVSKLPRKLIFDIIIEILNQNKELPPWNSDSGTSLKQIWSEFKKIREINMVDDLLESICGVLKRDLVGIKGWGDYPVEMSEVILDIERMIFKDLLSEAIRDLMEVFGRCMFLTTQRKLVF